MFKVLWGREKKVIVGLLMEPCRRQVGDNKLGEDFIAKWHSCGALKAIRTLIEDEVEGLQAGRIV